MYSCIASKTIPAKNHTSYNNGSNSALPGYIRTNILIVINTKWYTKFLFDLIILSLRSVTCKHYHYHTHINCELFE